MYYFILLITLLSAELLYFRLADNFNIIDKPNERSSHTRITLRGGGIVFPVGILIYFSVTDLNISGLFPGFC